MGRKRTYAAAMQLHEDLAAATKVIKEELVDAMVPDIALHRHHHHHHHQHHLHHHQHNSNSLHNHHTSSSSSSSPSTSPSPSPSSFPSSSFSPSSPSSSSSSSSDDARTPISTSYSKDSDEVPMVVPSGCGQWSIVTWQGRDQQQRLGASPSSSTTPSSSSSNTATVPTTTQHVGCGSASGDLTPVAVYSSPPTFPQAASPPPRSPTASSSSSPSFTTTSSSSSSTSSASSTSSSGGRCGSSSPVGMLVAEKYMLTSMLDQASCLGVDVRTQERFVVKILDGRNGHDLAAQHAYLGSCKGVRAPVEVVTSSNGRKAWVAFPAHHDDLHSYVRAKKRLREAEAQRLFAQIADTVARCHEAGLVLRDLKLRKFVFTDTERRELSLESLEDSVLVGEERDDLLEDKHGCPAYVAPEILTSAAYSGRAADMWGLGVMLYTMLVGRYPFHDTDHTMLFAKIRSGHFCVPEWVSSRARHLIYALLRRDPQLRLAAQDVLGHPWLTRPPRDAPPRDPTDHAVPQLSRIPPRLPHAHTKASLLSVPPTAPPMSMTLHAPHVPCL